MNPGNETSRPAPFGQMLVEELLWIHAKLRSDLEIVRGLAERVLAGMPAEQVRTEIRALQTNSPLWKIRTNCLYYCRFVHGHHTFEDTSRFPAIRHAHPDLESVVDKLEVDHRVIATYIVEVETAATGLVELDSETNRRRVFVALKALGTHMLEHLAYEEDAITPSLRTWREWPAVS